MYNEFFLITGYSYVRRIFLNSAPSVRGLYPCPRLPIPWLSQLKPLSNILRTTDALRISITEFVYLGILLLMQQNSWFNKRLYRNMVKMEGLGELNCQYVSSDCAELLHTFFLHLNENYETWFLNWKQKSSIWFLRVIHSILLSKRFSSSQYELCHMFIDIESFRKIELF